MMSPEYPGVAFAFIHKLIRPRSQNRAKTRDENGGHDRLRA